MGKRVTLEEFPNALAEILEDYSKEKALEINQAVEESARQIKDSLSKESPVASGKMAGNWQVRMNRRKTLARAKVFNRERGIVASYHNTGTSKMPSPSKLGFATKVTSSEVAKLYQKIKKQILEKRF